MPLARRMLLPGQWATPVPVRPNSSISPLLMWMQWACHTSAPVQAQRLHVGYRPLPKGRQAKFLLLQRLGQVGVQAHAVGAGQFRRGAHQVGGDGEGGAGRQHDAQHGVTAVVVVLLNQPPAVFENEGFIFGDAVGGQAALALAQRHGAARGVETHADLLRGADLAVSVQSLGKM
jgi:hypothetical protein